MKEEDKQNTGLPNVTWKDLKEKNSFNLQTASTIAVVTRSKTEIKNGTSRQVLGSDDEKQVQKME